MKCVFYSNFKDEVFADYGGSSRRGWHHHGLNAMQSAISAFFVFIPWINPFSLGPTPIVVNSIITAICLSACIIWTAALAERKEAQLPQSAIPAGWLWAATLSALAGLVQYAGVEQVFYPWVSNAQLGEAYGNLRQRNQFATLVNIGLVMVLWWRLLPSLLLRVPVTNIALWWLAFLLVIASAASSSRTGLLELMLVAGLAWLWRPQGNPWHRQPMLRMVMSCVVVYFAASVALPLLIGLDPNSSGILGRFRDGASACQSRLFLWSNVLHLIAQKPWTGWGWGELDYAHFITLYPGARFCDILDNAHNLPLHLAVELGVPVSAAFCAVCIWLIKREKPWREQDPMRQLAWTVLGLIGLHSLLEYPLWYGPFQMTVLLCFYILWRTPASWRGADSQVKPLPPALRHTASALAVAVMVVCAYAAWDYWRISQIYTAPSQRDPAYQDDTLNKIRGSWLFQNQVRFAELNITPLTKDNAEHINALAKEMLHFSPEPQVVKKLIESAVMLGRDDEAAFYLQRFKAAFPNAEL